MCFCVILIIPVPTTSKNPNEKALVNLTNHALFPFARRLYNQKRDARGCGVFYSGVVDCAARTARAEGVRGLYKGFRANLLRQLPHGMCTFYCLEQYRRLYDGAGGRALL